MEKTTLYLPADLQRSLKEAARRAGRPQAEIVRDALTQYLKKRRPMPRSIGIAASKGGPTAAESEDWLRKEWAREFDAHGRHVRRPRPARQARS